MQIFKVRYLLVDRDFVFTKLPGSERSPSLLNLSIDGASQGLQAGHFTSQDLVKAYLSRIQETSRFKAVLQVNKHALRDAEALDAERVQTGSRG